MPSAPPKSCSHPRCAKYQAKGGYCIDHQSEEKRSGWKEWTKGKSAHQRGYGAAWRKKRDAVLLRDDHLCQPCLEKGKLTQAKQVDHITNKANGGTDDDWNLQAICIECHKKKTARERNGRH